MARTQLHPLFPIVHLVMFAATLLLLAAAGQAQTYTVLHNFAFNDGSAPSFGLTSDQAGNLYGTTNLGGSHCGSSGCGTVFELVRNGSAWILKQLYDFGAGGANDGEFPESRVVFGPDGNLYGATIAGGQYGFGTIYRLQPPLSICKRTLCPWRETVLYNFTGLGDGGGPEGDLIFDTANNLYGTTAGGGTGSCSGGCGVVFQLTFTQGTWNYAVLYSFSALSDGALPESGVILDQSGNIYGTTVAGGAHTKGTIFELTKTGAAWTKSTLYDFQGGADGGFPQAGLASDPAGNLFGFTTAGGANNNGTAFEIQPSSGGWNYNTLLSFGGRTMDAVSTPVLDSAGNLYGCINSGSTHAVGAIFELKFLGGIWNYVSLHDFNVGDGAYPYGSVLLDGQGNLYGTASEGGSSRDGVVFEITPH